MRLIGIAASAAPLLIAACKPPCGLHLEAGSEAVVTLSNRTPEGPDLTWTVPGLSEAELEGYEDYDNGGSSPAGVGPYLFSEDLEGYVVARPRGDDWFPRQFYLAASLDGVFEGCFSEPLARLTVEFYDDPEEATVRFFTAAAAMDDWSINAWEDQATADFDAGRLSATGVRMNTVEWDLVDPKEYCLVETDIEVVWEPDPDATHKIHAGCGFGISMSG